MDNLRSKMSRAVATRRDEEKVAARKYNESSSKRLLTILEKKLQTSFIGALSQFEQEFGFLWGNRKDSSERTPEEKEMFEKWNRVRTNILNNGNNQIRAVQNEIQQYTVTWNRYRLDFKVDKDILKEDHSG